MTRFQRKNAVREALVVLVVIVSVVAAVLIAQARPAGPDQLKISVETLRSQAAELEVLLAQAQGDVPPRFAHAHAGQHRKAVDSARDELEGLKLEQGLETARSQAQPIAGQLAATVRRFSDAAMQPAPASVEAALAARRSLKALEESLQR
jgi:hypothetical protein